jgi:hypothetical protein
VHTFVQDLGQSSFAVTLINLGNLLWMLTYFLVIASGFSRKYLGIPVVAVTLNITWELIITVFCPKAPPIRLCQLDPFGEWYLTTIILLDFIILYQALRWGAKQLDRAFLKKHFNTFLACWLAFAFVSQHTYIAYRRDVNGTLTSWIINLVMSSLFVSLALRKPDAPLPRAVAWTKILANSSISAGLILYPLSQLPSFRAALSVTFVYLLLVSVFILDSFYLYLLYQRRRQELA